MGGIRTQCDVALYLERKIRLSIGDLLMIINVVILTCGGFLFGRDQAMHSIVAYILAYKTILFTLDYKTRRMIWVSCDRLEELTQLLNQEFNQEIQFLTPKSVTVDHNSPGIYFILPEKNIQKLKSIVQRHDTSANVTFSCANNLQTESYYKIR